MMKGQNCSLSDEGLYCEGFSIWPIVSPLIFASSNSFFSTRRTDQKTCLAIIFYCSSRIVGEHFQTIQFC